MKIALLGDIAFFGKFSLKNNNNLKDYFNNAAMLLKEYDLVVGNLETPFVGNERPFGNKSAYIKTEPINIELLKFLNIGIVNLANNHIFDYGRASYELTKTLLEENKIKYFGVENKQLIYEFEDNKIALNGYSCYSTNPMGINSIDEPGINELDFPIVKEQLRLNHESNLFSVLSFHIGQEHVNYPNYDHVKMARQLADVGPYIFYGHHPHVAQGIEKIKDSLIAYSLGNFCFDDVYTSKSKDPLIEQTENNKESFILELDVKYNKLVNFKIIPIYLGEDKMIVGDVNITDKINVYSKALSKNEGDYKVLRNNLLMNYISSRKKLRNINWYLKRLNYKSLLLIVASRKNAKKYLTTIKNHL